MGMNIVQELPNSDPTFNKRAVIVPLSTVHKLWFRWSQLSGAFTSPITPATTNPAFQVTSPTFQVTNPGRASFEEARAASSSFGGVSDFESVLYGKPVTVRCVFA